MDEPPRRRPRTGAPGPPPAPEPAGRPPAAGGGIGRWILPGAVALVLVVIGVATATGTADELPWGAIIGVAVVLALAYLARRRRPRP